MSDRRARVQQSKKFQELITGNTGNTGNETRSKRLRTSNYRNDNDNSTIVSFGNSSGRGNDNNDNSTIISSGSGRGRGKDNDDNSTINSSSSNDNNVEVIRQSSEISNNNPGIIRGRGIGAKDDDDNSIISGRGRGKGNDDSDDNSVIISGGSGRGRGKGKGKGLSNKDNNNNNFENNFEGIRKYIEVIIFRFIIKNFLFITYIRMIISCEKKMDFIIEE